MSRVEGRLKVTGTAPYAFDHPIPDVCYAVLVGSTIARGSIDGVDSTAARKLPGVLAVITDFGGVQLPYDSREVWWFGQPVAVVVAETLEAATHGASLVDVRYRTTSQLTDVDAPQAVRQPSRRPDYARGDADASLRNAAVVTDLRYSIARNNHNPIELQSLIANWDGDRLTVWDKLQGVVAARETYAKAFDVPVDSVRVISPYVGGAFGNASPIWPHQFLAALAARQLRRPVKLVLSRKQMYSGAGYRPASRQRLAIGADRSGHIGAIIHEAVTETARNNGYEDVVITGPARFLYNAPNMQSTYSVAKLDLNNPTAMRGPGMTSGAFALESAMDDLAYRLGMDPIELRLLNEPERDLEEGLPFSSRRLTDCFRQGAATFGWVQRNPTPRATRDGNLLIGMGTAAAAYHALRSGCSAVARVNADGTADVATAASDMGPGTYTSMTQVAADALGLPLGRVRQSWSSSGSQPPSPMPSSTPPASASPTCPSHSTSCSERGSRVLLRGLACGYFDSRRPRGEHLDGVVRR